MQVAKDTTNGKKYRVLCQYCKNRTNHIVLASIKVDGSEQINEEEAIYWKSLNEIIQCQGCDNISFRVESSNSESYDPIKGPIITEIVYPIRTVETINAKIYYSLPDNINRLYKETIECYNNGIFTLCAAGIRALVEGICIDKKIKDGNVEENDKNGNIKIIRKRNLEGKINGLIEKGVLTKENAESLHEHRYMGNEAVHQLSLPSKKELSLAISIIENIFDSIYEIHDMIEELKEARKRNKKVTI